jgi:hypothetical protein
MGWICPCGASNDDEIGSCRRCGYQFRQPPALEVPHIEEIPAQGETIVVAASEKSIRQKQSVAILGSLLLFVGAFLPIVSMPLGSTNYFDNGQGDGTFILVLAVTSTTLAITRAFGWLWITGLCSVGLLLFTLVNFLNRLAQIRVQMQAELADNPFKGIADVAMNSVQIQWGWAVLMLGGVLIVIAAAMPPQRVAISNLGRTLGKVINAAGGVVLLMWFLGYLGIVDNFVYRSIPLGTTPISHKTSQQTEMQPSPNKQISGTGDAQTSNPPASAPTPDAQTSLPPQAAAEQPADTSQSLITPQPSTATSSPAPPVEASKPTSGVLCSGVIAVPQNGELIFKNLPGDQLKFTFDHNAWQPTIRRQPDGTQTVVMRSIRPGIQTKCDMRWEVRSVEAIP